MLGIASGLTAMSSFNLDRDGNGGISWVDRYYGVLMLVSSYFFNSMIQVCSKILESVNENAVDESINPMQLLLIRNVISGMSIMFYIYQNSDMIKGSVWGVPEMRIWLFLRGVLGFIGAYGMFYSLIYLSISDAVLISFMAPSFTLILTWLIMKERLSRIEALSALLSFAGVILIVRPAFLFGGFTEDSTVEGGRLLATIIGLAGALGFGGVYVVLRFIGDRAHAISSVHYFTVVSILLSGIGALFVPSMRFKRLFTLKEWVLFIVIGLSGFVHQLQLAKGIQRLRAGKGTLMNYTQLVYAIVWDVVLWHDIPKLWSILGMMLIVGSTVSAIILQPPEEQEMKNHEDPELATFDDETAASVELQEFNISTKV